MPNSTVEVQRQNIESQKRSHMIRGMIDSRKIRQNLAWISRFYFQVYFLDIDVNEGKTVQKEFEDEFGEGMATFYECDVRNKDRVEGINVVEYTAWNISRRFTRSFVNFLEENCWNLLVWHIRSKLSSLRDLFRRTYYSEESYTNTNSK